MELDGSQTLAGHPAVPCAYERVGEPLGKPRLAGSRRTLQDQVLLRGQTAERSRQLCLREEAPVGDDVGNTVRADVGLLDIGLGIFLLGMCIDGGGARRQVLLGPVRLSQPEAVVLNVVPEGELDESSGEPVRGVRLYDGYPICVEVPVLRHGEWRPVHLDCLTVLSALGDRADGFDAHAGN